MQTILICRPVNQVAGSIGYIICIQEQQPWVIGYPDQRTANPRDDTKHISFSFVVTRVRLECVPEALRHTGEASISNPSFMKTLRIVSLLFLSLFLSGQETLFSGIPAAEKNKYSLICKAHAKSPEGIFFVECSRERYPRPRTLCFRVRTRTYMRKIPVHVVQLRHELGASLSNRSPATVESHPCPSSTLMHASIWERMLTTKA